MTPSYVLPPLMGLPLIGLALIRCNDPWKALVLRSSLGGFAALLFAAEGAVDVALTEALVGTLLSTLLYAVAIKSTSTFRLLHHPDRPLPPEDEQQLSDLLQRVGLKLTLVSQDSNDSPASNSAKLSLQRGDIHATFVEGPDDHAALLLRHRTLLAHLTCLDPTTVASMNLTLDPAITDS